MLEQENERLREQVSRLQDALVSATAPAAYQQILAAKAEAQPEKEGALDELTREAEAMKMYISELEDPRGVFRDPDEFISFFKGGMNPKLHRSLEEAAIEEPEPPGPLHGNSES